MLTRPTKVVAADSQESWSVVARRGKVRKTPAPVAVSKQDTQQESAKVGEKGREDRQRPSPKLKTPTTAAITLKLTAEATKKCVTLQKVMEKARSDISLPEVGITGGMTIKASQTGDKLLLVPGPDSGTKADALAARLRDAVAGLAEVGRPEKMAGLRVSGLKDTATMADVIKAVADKGSCPNNMVSASELRPGPGGSDSPTKADALARRLGEVMAELIDVSRPDKVADLRIVGLDDSITTDEVLHPAAWWCAQRPPRRHVGTHYRSNHLLICRAEHLAVAYGKHPEVWDSIPRCRWLALFLRPHRWVFREMRSLVQLVYECEAFSLGT
ncbi:unnamed protein product [Chilo suppressalis]|uniref:Uncharacterized protein n=1 Tax=Chilo suppressalis TaxID=168631 RepID=A0ABN8AYV4_CHISP|nr:unnamed protein product [Chilo suppressalis]